MEVCLTVNLNSVSLPTVKEDILSDYQVTFSQQEIVFTTYSATITDEDAQKYFGKDVDALSDSEKIGLAHYSDSLCVLSEETLGDDISEREVLSIEES